MTIDNETLEIPPVGQTRVHHAHCPVLIVRPKTEDCHERPA